ncbi:MAG TPA: amidohydrolase family protein [Anaerolineales bacterium]|nr:amidohydrolase family protein [Anaerolineales bacterium]
MSRLIESHRLLEWAQEVSHGHPLWDAHIHPFEVLTGDLVYQKNEKFDGLLSKPGSVYHPPILEKSFDQDSSDIEINSGTGRAFLLASRLKYTHTGPKVVYDQLQAAGLTNALILPVTRTVGLAMSMLEATAHTFSTDDQLLIGCPFPLGLSANELFEFFRMARDHYGTRAIKLHPNLTGIDPLDSTGRELIESTLEAAGELGLPLIIHTGRTSVLMPRDESEFGMLSRLKTINWGLSTAPVVFAHAGCHDLAEDEAREALSILDALFQKHPNLMANTANLSSPLLRLVLERTDRSRLLFGSDAFYVPIWKAWLRFLNALRMISTCPEDDLIRIASLNPANCLGTMKTV